MSSNKTFVILTESELSKLWQYLCISSGVKLKMSSYIIYVGTRVLIERMRDCKRG